MLPTSDQEVPVSNPTRDAIQLMTARRFIAQAFHYHLYMTNNVNREVLFVLRFYDPVNSLGSCRAWSLFPWQT